MTRPFGAQPRQGAAPDPRFPQKVRAPVGVDPERVQMIVQALSPADRHQLADLLDYATQLADPKQNPNGHIPEGNVAALFARQPPAVRAALDAIGQFAATSRFAPFDDKLSEAERFLQVGIKPEAVTLLAASDGLDVINSLRERMGGDAPRTGKDTSRHAPLGGESPRWPSPGPSTRDHLAASVELHEPMRQRTQAVEEYLTNAAEGRSLRDTLSISLDTVGYDDRTATAEDRSDMGKWIEATVGQGDF